MAALLELAAAAGQRLLLQAATPAGEEAAAAATPAPAPTAGAAATNDTASGGYQVGLSRVWLGRSHAAAPPAPPAAPLPSSCRTHPPAAAAPPQVSFGSSACQNMTGSLPICYNTVISGENLLTG